MSILSPITATEERYRQREAERESNRKAIKKGEILAIAANSSELVRRRMLRLHADPDFVLSLKGEGLAFDPQGPGTAPRQFPRALERVLDTNDLMGLRFFEQGLRVSRAVGRIHIRGGGGETQGYGTGFLVSSRLLLTNHHVSPSAAEAMRSRVEFNDQEDASGEMQASEMFALDPETLFLCDEEHDYALVAVEAEPGLFLHYETDTDPGSSGSPVFNDQWEVVALHHSGVPKRDKVGRVLTIDGRVWQESMGEQRIAWLANEGVRVSRLVRHIRAQALPAEAEALRQELLQATPPPLEGFPVVPLAAAASPAAANAPVIPVAAGVTTPAGLTAAGGVATWTIPLQLNLSVSLGAAPPPPAAAGGGQREEELLGLFGQRPAPAAKPAVPTAADFRLVALERTAFDWQTAQSLALASQLAYSPAAEVERQARAWGFADCRFVEAGAAQGFLASTASVVLVTFRGTESTADWLSNLQVQLKTVPGLGKVHAGFWGQFTALQAQLETLLEARRNVPLVVSGHSLGGAIAVLAAATWAANPAADPQAAGVSDGAHQRNPPRTDGRGWAAPPGRGGGARGSGAPLVPRSPHGHPQPAAERAAEGDRHGPGQSGSAHHHPADLCPVAQPSAADLGVPGGGAGRGAQPGPLGAQWPLDHHRTTTAHGEALQRVALVGAEAMTGGRLDCLRTLIKTEEAEASSCGCGC
jgi:hypothetical protein